MCFVFFLKKWIFTGNEWSWASLGVFWISPYIFSLDHETGGGGERNWCKICFTNISSTYAYSNLKTIKQLFLQDIQDNLLHSWCTAEGSIIQVIIWSFFCSQVYFLSLSQFIIYFSTSLLPPDKSSVGILGLSRRLSCWRACQPVWLFSSGQASSVCNRSEFSRSCCWSRGIQLHLGCWESCWFPIQRDNQFSLGRSQVLIQQYLLLWSGSCQCCGSPAPPGGILVSDWTPSSGNKCKWIVF